MVKKIPIDTYPVSVYLFKPCEYKVARKFMEKKYGTDQDTLRDMFRHDGYSFTITNTENNVTLMFLWIRDWEVKTGYWPAVLAHELGHVIDCIKDYLGIQEPTIGLTTGREVHAYMMSFLYRKCYDQLEKWRRKHGRRKKTAAVPVNADNA